MTQNNLSTVQQPIDYEALPLPYAHAPQIIQTLVKQEPDCVCAFFVVPSRAPYPRSYSKKM